MFKNINPKDILESPISLIGERWMLISAGNKAKFNSMTASWGGIGFMWGKPVAFVVIRPPRYTFEFVEKNASFTLSFFAPQYKKILSIFGSKSGRDCDKVAETGLTPFFTASGNLSYEESELVIECTKLYAQPLDADSFIDKAILDRWYDGDPLHKLYVAEITNVLKKA